MASGSSPLAVLRSVRAWNISVRTAHLAAMGVLLGGHAFDVSKCRLLPWLLAWRRQRRGARGARVRRALLWLTRAAGWPPGQALARRPIPFFWRRGSRSCSASSPWPGLAPTCPPVIVITRSSRGEIIRDPPGRRGSFAPRPRIVCGRPSRSPGMNTCSIGPIPKMISLATR